MIVAGLDLSLTSTGVALPDGPRTISTRVRGCARLAYLRDVILELVARADLVAVEGYSFGSARFGSQAHALGELGGVVRVALWEARIPYADVPPAVLKRYASGQGNATKGAMLAAAIRRLGYDGSSHDEADALWLRALAHDACGDPIVAVPESHRSALSSVAWPEVVGA